MTSLTWSPTAVVLTKDEERHVEACLASLLAQRTASAESLEILVVDAASRDATVAIVRAIAETEPRVRLVEAGALSVGAARNLGVREAAGDVVLFLSADAEAQPGWLDAALSALERSDVVYGRQTHAPLEVNAATVARGLRYHPYDHDPPLDPLDRASNVSAAYRRDVLMGHPFPEGTAEGALDDVLVARRARRAGLRVAYAPGMGCLHRDVADARAEARKMRREGLGWGLLHPELGWNQGLLAWAVSVASALLALALLPAALGLPLLLLVLAAPTLRRVLRRRARYPGSALAGALALAPLLDLLQLASYVEGLARGTVARAAATPSRPVGP